MTNNTTLTAANTITSAQLFWDAQDQRTAGWWLRYTDASGTEQGDAIDGAEDATTEDLAAAVAARIPSDTGRVTVLRGERPRGWIDVANGEVVGWRA